jgi:DNA mismatch repair ATPase MutS
MQKKLICVRGCIDCAQAINCAVQANPEMIGNLTHVARLAALVDASKAQNLSPELQEFLTLIKTDTFAGQSSKLSHYGRILRAHDLMQKVQPELQTYLQGVAEVDLHASCAKLVQENKSTATPYTFAQYVHDNRARLAIQGFWNPLVPKPEAIVQEVALGGQANPQVAVVTGANTGGKSTSLANIGSAVHLSQTLGIAPAQKFELTPFAKTITGFNMTTRVGDGQSLFSTSLDLANKVLTVTKNGSTEKVFIALDELFNSTDHAKGQAVAIEFVKRMMEKENAVMFFATHFPELAKLEAESAGKCRNLKAEKVDGVYQITPGASNGTQAFKLISHGDSLLVKE